MHAWTKSACVVLAWSVLSILLMTAGMKGSVHPAQANTRTTRSTEVIRTSTLIVRRRDSGPPPRFSRPPRLALGRSWALIRGPARNKARIVVADYDRLVVTCSKRDDTVYVLRPPGEDPKTILRVARLVLPEVPYEELASQLGLSASMPMK